MKNRFLLIGLLTICVLAVAGPVSAQLYRRGNGYYDDGGMAGAVALASSNRVYSNQMQMGAQNQQSAQQAASQQNMALQSGIRNTLTTQAQDRTNTIEDQRQSYRDWWFQTNQQKIAGNQPNVIGSTMPMAGGYGSRQSIGSSIIYEASHPPVALDIIMWPVVLQEKIFASERAQIETPYRRSPPGLSTPTATDYRNMVKTVGDMKSVLEWRLGQNGGLPTVDYEQAKAFLNNLAQEAQERAKRSGASSNPDRTPAPTS
jgi:hypothetical protein